MVAAEAKKFVRKNGLVTKVPKPEKATPQVLAKREVDKLRTMLEKLPHPKRFDQLLLGIAILIDQSPTRE